MTPEEQNKVNELWEDNKASCARCTQEVNPSDCEGCPIYAWGFSDD